MHVLLACLQDNSCSIDGVCYATGDASPDNSCRVCDHHQDPMGWSEGKGLL